jgi:hypothetical protein
MITIWMPDSLIGATPAWWCGVLRNSERYVFGFGEKGTDAEVLGRRVKLSIGFFLD